MSVGAQRKSLEPWLRDDIAFYDYQVEGVRFGLRQKDFILGDDMGLGKSLQALAVFCADVARGWGQTLLVVAPATLRANWAQELRKFTSLPFTLLGETVGTFGQLKKLTKSERKAQIVEFWLGSGPRVLITNYEQIPAHWRELNKIQFHMTVFDEAHALGNEESQRTQACIRLKSRRKVPCTGTLVTLNVKNLWALLRMVEPTTPNYATFMNRHAVYGGFRNKSIIGTKNKEWIHEVLQRKMIRRLKSDVLKDLPAVHKIPIFVTLSDEQEKLYREVVNEFQLTTAHDPSNPMMIDNHLLKMLRLREICSTTLKFTGEDHSNKLADATERTIALIESGERVVVFTQFRHVNDAFVSRLRKERPNLKIWQVNGHVPKEKRIPTVNEWAASEPGVIVCGLQVGAVGLNMTAARYSIFLDKLVVPALNRQAVDRLHRIGASKTQPVTIFEYITVGTVEERIEEICKIKVQTNQELVEDAIKSEASMAREIAAELFAPIASQTGQLPLTTADVASALRQGAA